MPYDTPQQGRDPQAMAAFVKRKAKPNGEENTEEGMEVECPHCGEKFKAAVPRS